MVISGHETKIGLQDGFKQHFETGSSEPFVVRLQVGHSPILAKRGLIMNRNEPNLSLLLDCILPMMEAG